MPTSTIYLTDKTERKILIYFKAEMFYLKFSCNVSYRYETLLIGLSVFII